MKKHLVIAATAATIGLAGLSAGVAHAATTDSTTKTDPMSSLVDKIATKFNLNKTEVQQVFDAQKTERQAERETEVKADVAKLVADGKITQAQADLINAKRAELQKQHESNKAGRQGTGNSERKAAMEKQKTELEAWAKQNGIDAQYLRYVMGGGHGHGGSGGRHGNMDGNETTSQTP
jgi:ribosomal protein L19E